MSPWGSLCPVQGMGAQHSPVWEQWGWRERWGGTREGVPSHCITLTIPARVPSGCRYMKYLYPYECEKRGLSNPNELQAAIDSNRREGRRQGFGGSLFAYSPGGTHSLLSSPKLPVPALGLASATNGGAIAPGQKIKKGKRCCGVWVLQGLAAAGSGCHRVRPQAEPPPGTGNKRQSWGKWAGG